jgi:uncharacterized protein (TIGR02391 family)
MALRSQISPRLWEAVSQSYESGLYTAAIVEAIHLLSEILREKANVDGDGKSLVGQALGGDSPKLRINKFQTESEKNEQKGFELMLLGLYQGIRNPRSHNRIQDDQVTADAIINFIDYILNVIDKAKQPFTMSNWLEKAFDSYFVVSEQYAQLLAAEVPQRNVGEALIQVFRDRSKGKKGSAQLLVDELVKRASREQIAGFTEVLSEEFKSVKEPSVLSAILGVIPDSLWPEINRTAQIRVENWLLQEIEAGKYIKGMKGTVPGWLGTWARDFLVHFSHPDAVADLLINKLLNKDEKEAEYVANFLFDPLLQIAENPKFCEGWGSYFVDNLTSIAVTTLSAKHPPILYDKSLALYNYRKTNVNWRELIDKGLAMKKKFDEENELAAFDDVSFDDASSPVEDEDIPFEDEDIPLDVSNESSSNDEDIPF